MAEVLRHSLQADTDISIQSARTKASQSPLFIKTQEYDTRTRNSKTHRTRSTSDHKAPASSPSSAPSSPQTHPIDSSSADSLLSTPSSILSLDGNFSDRDGEMSLRSADSSPEDLRFPDATPYSSTDQFYGNAADLDDDDCQTKFYRSGLSHPEFKYQSASDDTVLAREPTRHVDYLSHDWREEDIWCSWRHIVSRRSQLDNSRRLENAVWRTWAKSRSGLKTVSPEKLNWMKDNDVTWLYGPLQTINPQNVYLDSLTSKSSVSRTDSFLCKKPILKKHSMSEIMLRKSLSNSTLVRQAVDALATRLEGTHRSAYRAEPDHNVSALPTPQRQFHEGSSIASSSTTTTSGTQTPSVEKHIHFNDKVEQCIAINKDADEVYDNSLPVFDDELESDSSDDGILMMHDNSAKVQNESSINLTPRGSFSSDSNPNKTIAMLPSTTLKYRGDTPEPPETITQEKRSSWTVQPRLSHSNSSETLRPPKPSSNFLLEDEDDDSSVTWYSSSSQGNNISGSSFFHAYDRPLNAREDEEIHSRGLRRTPSGMFMPYEIDKEAEAGGIFDKVLDTVNTARDIAHVIWNVGWRR